MDSPHSCAAAGSNVAPIVRELGNEVVEPRVEKRLRRSASTRIGESLGVYTEVVVVSKTLRSIVVLQGGNIESLVGLDSASVSCM